MDEGGRYPRSQEQLPICGRVTTKVRRHYEDGKEELTKSQTRQKYQFHRKAKEKEFKVGETVLVLLPTDSEIARAESGGFFSSEKDFGLNDYEVNLRGMLKVYLANLLKRCHGRGGILRLQPR